MASASGGSARLAAGSVVAGLRIEERIGSGGMAMVFRAYDDRLRRRVALKVLDDQFAASATFRRRFVRESRAAAAVEDPHIIPVYDAGEADGVLYISMRYIAAGDLRSLIAREGPLAAATVADFVGQVASALDAAHRAGLVHRDVKPANMLRDQGLADAPGHIYLSDFGLSKPPLQSFQLTATGQLLGTLDYIAPEQVNQPRIDGRADQYALACTAFELLTGIPPFGKRQGMALIRAHLTELPPPAASLRADLSPAVDAVLSRALAKDPRARYPSCRKFAGALAAAIATPVVPVLPPGMPAVAPAATRQVASRRAVMPPVPHRLAARPAPPTRPRLIGARPELPGPPEAASGPAHPPERAGVQPPVRASTGTPPSALYDAPTRLAGDDAAVAPDQAPANRDGPRSTIRQDGGSDG